MGTLLIGSCLGLSSVLFFKPHLLFVMPFYWLASGWGHFVVICSLQVAILLFLLQLILRTHLLFWQAMPAPKYKIEELWASKETGTEKVRKFRKFIRQNPDLHLGSLIYFILVEPQKIHPPIPVAKNRTIF